MRRFLLLPALLLVVSGCDRGDDIRDINAGLREGNLVFEEDFEGGELGEAWVTGFAGWQVRDGELHVQGAENDALWLQEALPEKFRVEFKARSESDEGDIKFEILGDGSTHESGYVGIFGGWNNRLNVIARQDEHGEDRLVGAPGISVEPGRDYQMALVRSDHRLRWYIDGELFMTYDDPAPLRGEEHRYFGFNNWRSPVYFDDMRIFELGD